MKYALFVMYFACLVAHVSYEISVFSYFCLLAAAVADCPRLKLRSVRGSTTRTTTPVIPNLENLNNVEKVNMCRLILLVVVCASALTSAVAVQNGTSRTRPRYVVLLRLLCVASKK